MCDNDEPSSSTRVLTPASPTITRGSRDGSYTEQQPRPSIKRSKKKKTRQLSELHLLENQLVMVAGGPEAIFTFNVV